MTTVQGGHHKFYKTKLKTHPQASLNSHFCVRIKYISHTKSNQQYITKYSLFDLTAQRQCTLHKVLFGKIRERSELNPSGRGQTVNFNHRSK